MQSIGDIRRKNLGLLKDRFGTWVALNRALNRNERDATLGQIWNQNPDSKTGKPREMGTSLARGIERTLDLHAGWMDTPTVTAPDANAVTALDPTPYDDPARTVRVPMLAVAASMGPGIERPSEDIITGALSVSTEWARRELHLAPSRVSGLRFITGYGSSMEPTFRSGDVLLVDTMATAVDVDGVYVLARGTELLIKRVTRGLDGSYDVSSDNPVVRKIDALNGDHSIAVRGRVLFIWNGKKV